MATVDLVKLAEKVERASGDPDKLRELDYRVMHATLPAGRAYLWDPNGASYRYTTSLDAVTALIRERLPGAVWRVGVVDPHDGRGDALVEGHEPGDYCATPVLALLSATLRALAKETASHV